MPLLGLSCKTQLHSIDFFISKQYLQPIRTGKRRGVSLHVFFLTKTHCFQPLLRTSVIFSWLKNYTNVASASDNRYTIGRFNMVNFKS